jgi:hypothetical protein
LSGSDTSHDFERPRSAPLIRTWWNRDSERLSTWGAQAAMSYNKNESDWGRMRMTLGSATWRLWSHSTWGRAGSSRGT